MISIHWRVSRDLYVSHISRFIKRNTLLLPSLAWKLSAKAFSSFDSTPLTQTFSHARKTRQEKTFDTLVTIPATAFTHFFWWRVLCSAIRSPSQEKREENENKTKEMKGGKNEFSAMKHYDFEELVKRNNQEKQLEKNKKGQRKTLTEREERWREEKKRREMDWCNECPGAEINDKWVHIDLTRSTTSRHAAMVKRAFNRARDPHRVRILNKFFSVLFFEDSILLKEIQISKNNFLLHVKYFQHLAKTWVKKKTKNDERLFYIRLQKFTK